MKRKRILTQYLLYFLMFMFLIVAGCSSSDDNNDTTPTPTVDRWVTVSGTVTTATGAPLQGVLMSTMYQLEVLNINLWEGSIDSDLFSWIFTDKDGNYEITLPAALVENYTLILTPSKKDYTFTPAQRTITVSTEDIPGQNFTATASNQFSQADLVGRWRINMLRSGTENLWMRAKVTIGPTGVATCNSWYYSTDPTNNLCLMPDPADQTRTVAAPFDLTLTMNDGVITQSGSHAVGDGGHMTMNSRKNFMAGTGTAGTSYQLMIAQKEPPNFPLTLTAGQTTQYNPADVQGKNFVFHSLSVGTTNEWRYGNGSTASSLAAVPGLISMAAEADSAGGIATTLDGWTLSLAPDGYVTRTDAAGLLTDFQGFLSADERTIVGTYSEGTLTPTNYRMIVIQLTDAQTMDEMTGGATNHLLAVAPALTPLWAYHDIQISRFETTFLPDILQLTFALNVMLSYDWQLSLPYTATEKLLLIDLEKINFASNGVVTILDRSTNPDTTIFHGQLAFDGSFMVGVETLTLDEGVFYALDVITHE